MPYLLLLKKRQNLKLSAAANYRWHFMGYTSFLATDDLPPADDLSKLKVRPKLDPNCKTLDLMVCLREILIKMILNKNQQTIAHRSPGT